MAPQPLLEIDLHLINGRTHRYTQSDPAWAQQILAQIGPKVFTRPSLVVTGHGRSAAYAGASLVGISLLIEVVPDALLHSGPFPALPLEITEADYRARSQGTLPIAQGRPGAAYGEIEFTSGHRLWLEAVPPAVSGMAERHLLHTLFSMPGLLCRRLGGGVSLWNGAQMASCAFAPEMDAPANAWSATFER